METPTLVNTHPSGIDVAVGMTVGVLVEVGASVGVSVGVGDSVGGVVGVLVGRGISVAVAAGVLVGRAVGFVVSSSAGVEGALVAATSGETAASLVVTAATGTAVLFGEETKVGEVTMGAPDITTARGVEVVVGVKVGKEVGVKVGKRVRITTRSEPGREPDPPQTQAREASTRTMATTRKGNRRLDRVVC